MLRSTPLRWLPPFVCLLLVLFSRAGAAFEAPAFQGDVLDETGALSQADQDALGQRIRELREGSGIWAAVYIAKGLQGESIEDATVAVFEKWKLGQAKKDNGILVMVVPAERKMRIEVGYGLEGAITDAFSKRVIDEIYKPAFRDQRYADGLLQGFDAMAKAVAGEALPPPSEEPAPQQEVDWSQAGSGFLLVFLVNLVPPVLFTLAAIYGRRHGRGTAKTLWGEVQTTVIVFAFLGLVFGLFFGVFTAAVDAEAGLPLALGNLLFGGVFGLPAFFAARRYLSQKAFWRYKDEQRNKPKGKSRGGWLPDSDSSSGSSSSSSSDSDSSSSGGGSSGGGGASGDW